MHQEVTSQHPDIISTPGEEDAILCAPTVEVGERLLKREAILQVIIRDTGQSGDFLVHGSIVLGLHHDFEGINDLQVFIQLHRTNLNDLALQAYRALNHDARRVRLIPFQI